MKATKIFTIQVLVLMLMVCLATVSKAEPMGTAFTFQGRLMDKNKQVEGSYDFQFNLYDSNDPCTGTQLGQNDINDVNVIDGYFVVELDFGIGVFDGNAVWLETKVVRSPMGSEPYALRPLMELTPVPYALQTRGIFADANGNVGIGTTSPDEKLHVDGNLKVRNIALSDSDITDRDSLRVIIDRDDDQTSQTFSVWHNGPQGAELFRIQENGRVGIGTNNPGAGLEVEHNEENVPAMRIDKTGRGGGLYIDNVGVGYGIHVRQNGVSGIFLEQYENSEAMIIHKKGTGKGLGLSIANDGTGKGLYLQQNGLAEGLYIEQNANAPSQVIGNYGTSSGLLIDQTGELVSGEGALLVGSGTPQSISHLVKFIQFNGSSTADTFWLDNYGKGHGIWIRQNGVLANGKNALYVYSGAEQTNSPLVTFRLDNESTDQTLLNITNDGSGYDIYDSVNGAFLKDGHWVNGCSIMNKENLEEVNRTDILTKVEELRIRQFNMKGSTDKHISATAEDFHAIFGLGDDKGISAGDVASIALICIKELKAENEALKERVQVLERTVQKRQLVNVEEAQK